MLLNHSRGTLTLYSDRSDDDPLQIQGAYGQWFNAPNDSPNSFKTCIKKLCVARRLTVLLCLYIFVGKIEQTNNVSKITPILTSYVLNCCIRSVSHLHSCALSILLMWYCLTIWCKYETKTQTGAFFPHTLNIRGILYVLLAHAMSCCPASYLSSINWMKCQMTHVGLGRGECVNNFIFHLNLINRINYQP